MSGEPVRVTVLGTITMDDGQTVAFDLAPDASPAEIAAALVAAEAQRIAAQAAETARLRKLFLENPADDDWRRAAPLGRNRGHPEWL